MIKHAMPVPTTEVGVAIAASSIIASIFVVLMVGPMLRMIRNFFRTQACLDRIPFILLASTAACALISATIFLTEPRNNLYGLFLLFAVGLGACYIAARTLLTLLPRARVGGNQSLNHDADRLLHPQLSRNLFLAGMVLLIAAGIVWMTVMVLFEFGPRRSECVSSNVLHARLIDWDAVFLCSARTHDNAYFFASSVQAALGAMLIVSCGALRVGLKGRVAVGAIIAIAIGAGAAIWHYFADDYVAIVWIIAPILIIGIVLASLGKRRSILFSVIPCVCALAGAAMLAFIANPTDEEMILALLGLLWVTLLFGYTAWLTWWQQKPTLSRWRKSAVSAVGVPTAMFAIVLLAHEAAPYIICVDHKAAPEIFACQDPPYYSSSFPRGTAVLTNTGARAIEEIEVGDKVLSYDMQRGLVTSSHVVQTFSRKAADLLEINKALFATSKHPFAMFDTSGSFSWERPEDLECRGVPHDAARIVATDFIAPVSGGCVSGCVQYPGIRKRQLFRNPQQRSDSRS